MKLAWTLKTHRLCHGDRPVAFVFGSAVPEVVNLVKNLNEIETLRAELKVTKHNYKTLCEECRAVEA